ncbi:hypothetical protein MLD38_027921 [Melastoma candidum]|uniref:Uncharacterized protein n=1 Tax=Melastoma candidum TaxID=119954 RepID=A0ACB9MZM1_9MYRT|nr:hypothetical protein MLD38_027921 [Melastoma candidum]
MGPECPSPSKAKTFISRFSPTNSKSKIAVALSIIFVLSSLGLVYRWRSSGNRSAWSYSYDRYTVVLDCGSTGTRVNAYQWAPAIQSQVPVLVNSYPGTLTGIDATSSCERQYHCLQTRPGLDKFVGNSSGVRKSVKPLLRLAEKWIPQELHGETPVFVLGTAGLRRLSSADSVRVLSDVWEVVKDTGFLSRRSWIRVLSGEEEGYYSWVALNFRMGRLSDLPSRIPTLGVIDLGGSSLQVAVELNESMSRMIEKGLTRLKYGSVQYQVLAYSLPRLGLQDTFERSVSMVMENDVRNESAGGNNIVRHPCFGLAFKQRLALFYDGQCRTGISNGTFLKVKDLENKNHVLVTGYADWQECIQLARDAATMPNQSLPETTVHKKEEASHNGNQIHNLMAIAAPNGSFHALSGFFAVYNQLNLTLRWNLTQALDRGRQICSRSWNTKSKIPGKGEFCFQVPYIASLIDEVLHLGNKEIVFGPGNVSWTLGAVLVERLLVGTSSAESMDSIPSYKSLVLVFVLLLLFGLIICQSQIRLLMSRNIGGAPATTAVSLTTRHPKRQPI